MSSPLVEDSWRVAVLGTTVLSNPSLPAPPAVVARQDLVILTTLAALAHNEEFVDSEVIEEYAWETKPSARALQSSIYRLRNALGPQVIDTRRRAVRLSSRVVVDLDEFTAAASRRDQHAALALVRGTPFATIGEHQAWRELRARWTTRIDAVRDAHVKALMDGGKLSAAVDIIVSQISADPKNSVRWQRLVDSLAGLGRRVDALRAVDVARKALAAAGLDLDPTLLKREQELLRGELAGEASADGPRPGTVRRFIEKATAVVGRDREVAAAVEALDSGLDPVVALVSRPDMGTLRMARVIAATMASRGWRIITPQDGDGLDGLWEREAASLVGQRGLVAIEFTRHTTDEVAALAREAITPGTRRVLIRVIDRSGSDSAGVARALRATLGVPVHVVMVEPLEGRDLIAVAGSAIEVLGYDEVAMLTAGLPALARHAATLAAEGRPADVIAAEIVAKRCSSLSPAAVELLAAVVLSGGSATLTELTDLVGVPLAVTRGIAAELSLAGWTVPFNAQRMTIYPQLGRLLVANVNVDVIDRLAESLVDHPEPSMSRLQLLVDAAEASSRTELWSAAVKMIAELSWSTVESSPDVVADLARRILSGAPEGAGGAAGMALVRSRLGMVTRFQTGDADRWTDSAAAFRQALFSGTVEQTFRVVRDAMFPSSITVSEEGEFGRGMVATLLRRSDLDPRIEIEAQAISAFHELARGDRRCGVHQAMEAIRRAEAMDDRALLAAVSEHVSVDLVFDRSLVSAGETAYEFQLGQRHLAGAVRALVYLLCAGMRRGTTTFHDPLVSEMMALLDTDRIRSSELRAAGVLTCAAALRVSTEWPMSPSVNLNPNFDAPVRASARTMMATLSSTPDWTSLAPSAISGDPARWRVAAEPDLGLWSAAQAVDRGDLSAAADSLGRVLAPTPGADIDLTMTRQSSLVSSRVPIAALVAARVGDRHLAQRILDAHISLRGSDLCHLPAIHLGPASSWLALLAETAGDDRASALHAEAEARLRVLRAHVLELS